jgi:hypothetical protein
MGIAIALLVLWLLLIVLGLVIKGLFWLTVIAAMAFLVTVMEIVDHWDYVRSRKVIRLRLLARRFRRRLLADPEIIAVFRLPMPAGMLVQLVEELPKIFGDDLMFQLVDGHATFRKPSHAEGESDS